MAERRMFAKTIIDSDSFLDMPLSTQALYFHLSMRADDEGFINNPKKIQRMIGAAEDDLKVLMTKNFIIPFESGIVVIKHWKVHNYIRGDRMKRTIYEEEAALLGTKKNGAYTLNPGLSVACQSVDGQVVGTLDTQDRLGKDRLGKESIDGAKRKRFSPPTIEEVNDYCKERKNSVDPQRWMDHYEANGWMVGKNKMKDWKAAIRTWERNGFDSKPKQAYTPTDESEWDF